MPEHHTPIEEMPPWALRIENKLDRLDTLISGGSEPDRGIISRLSVLRQNDEARTFWTRTAIGGVVASLVASAWSVLSSHRQ